MPSFRDRRRAQAGTTLVELLVSLTIVGLTLVLVIGTLSTGLLDAALTKRNTAAQAVAQYELDQISASRFSNGAQSYSECFATESTASPVAAGYLAPCPAGNFTLRADVTWNWLRGSASTQVWTVTVNSWPPGAQTNAQFSVYKVNR
jgi:type II secretory pathway pseudopilin PulG